MNKNTSFMDRAARNTVVILAARLIELGSGFLTMMILCRYLKPALFGDFAFVSAIILAFQPLVNLEMNTILIREISKDRSRQNELLGGAILLKAVLMGLFICAAIALDLYLGLRPLLRIAYYLALTSELFQQISWVFSTPFMAKERMEFEMFSVLIFRIVHLSGIAMLPLLTMTSQNLDLGFLGVFTVILSAHIVKAILNWRVSSLYFQMSSLSCRWTIARQLFDQMWIMGLATFCTGLSLRIDVYFLKAFHSSIEVSMFHVPHMIALQMQILAVAMVTATYPILSRLGGDPTKIDQFRHTRNSTFRLLAISGITISAVISGFAPLIVKLIAGNSFEGSTRTLEILALCIPILFLNYLGANLLTALKHQHLLIYGAAASLLCNIILDSLWVPSFGAIGASWATVISYSLQLAILGFLYHRLDPAPLNLASMLIGPVSVASIMSASMILTPQTGPMSYILDGSITLIGCSVIVWMQPREILQLLKRRNPTADPVHIDNTARKY